MKRPAPKPALSGRGVMVLLTVLLVSTVMLIVLMVKNGEDLMQCPTGQHVKNWGSQSGSNRWVCVDDQTGLVATISPKRN